MDEWSRSENLMVTFNIQGNFSTPSFLSLLPRVERSLPCLAHTGPFIHGQTLAFRCFPKKPVPVSSVMYFEHACVCFMVKHALYFYFLSCFFCNLIFILYWSIINLQYCVSFRYIDKWFSYTYIYIFFKLFSHIGYCRILSRVLCKHPF